MESVSFTSSGVTRNNFQANNVVPLVKVKINGFNAAEDQTPVMACGHRLLCFTNKKPTDLRVLDRIHAKKVDLTMTFNVSFVAAVSGGDGVFAAAGESFVALVAACSHPDGSLTAEQKHLIALEEPVRSIAVAANNNLLVLTTAGRLVTVKPDGSTTSFVVPAATKGATLKCGVVAACKEGSLAVVPAKGAALDVVSLNSEKSVLAKPWMPHGDDVPSSAYFFQSRASDGASGRCHIMTGANNNTELRFWILNEQTNMMTLVQQFSLTTTGEGEGEGAATVTDDDRMLMVSSDEEYILLGSRKTGSVVVIEMHRQQFKPTRATDWNPAGCLLVCTPFIRKVQEGKSLTMDLAAVVRTPEMISIVTFDAGRLLGASNLSSAAASASAPTTSASTAAVPSSTGTALGSRQQSVNKWFGGETAATAIPTPNSASTPIVASAPLPTSVSSSISGRYSVGADSQFITNQAVGAIKGQTIKFREALVSIDEQIVQLQKQASLAIKALQDAKSKDDAQLAGREFALRNKNRLAGGSGSNTANASGSGLTPGGGAAMTVAQVELMQGLRNFVDSLAPSVRDASSDTCRKLLGSSLPGTIARAMAAAESADAEVDLPSISVTKTMQQFSLAVDKIHQSQNNILKQERNAVEALSVRLMQGGERINRIVAASKSHMSQLKAELSGLRNDVRDARDAVRNGGSKGGASSLGGAAAQAVSIEKVVEEATRLANVGQWEDAVVMVERTGELGALLHFLISMDEQAAVLVDPSTLPMTLAVQVCYRLALNLRSQVGNAPTRCKWIHDFLVDWDETLEACKMRDPKSFALVSEQLEAVLTELTQIDVRKDVDRATKNRITLCKRLLSSLLG